MNTAAATATAPITNDVAAAFAGYVAAALNAAGIDGFNTGHGSILGNGQVPAAYLYFGYSDQEGAFARMSAAARHLDAVPGVAVTRRSGSHDYGFNLEVRAV